MNSIAIINRLREVLEHYNLTSSTFADTIDVQRSSISHLMSGRNKPSLDFVMKVVDKFPEVDFYWLLRGEGNFPKSHIEKKAIKVEEKKTKAEIKTNTPSLFSQNEPIAIANTNTQKLNNNKKLVKVILFYEDGSFEDFNK